DSHAPAAETDGPPAALMLAELLAALGTHTVLVGDRHVRPVLETGLRHCRIAGVPIAVFPDDVNSPDAADRWCRAVLRGALGQRLTHLVAVERAGPSHTIDSVRRQANDEATVRCFVASVPADDHDRCHNMRGEVIDRFTPPLHRLFELAAAESSPLATIGVGDGGNEIGMGSLPWRLFDELARRPADAAEKVLSRVACRVATDTTIVAGTSNWGGFALALGVAALRGLSRTAVVDAVGHQRDLVERLVDQGGAVDGFSGRRRPLVDGLDTTKHFAALAAMHDLFFTAD
ncbi:MAG: DUF4392 domain-containing protein, partial [Planctomycetales bacterium]|nr:DUF4392 domain-containing protein [Planctomycetales bacterium]